MIEQTLVILKPDLLKKGLEYKVLERIQNKGFEIIAMYKDSPKKSVFREHYKRVIADEGEEIGRNILNYITSGPVIVALIKGDDAVSEMRKLCGEKIQSKDCLLGTIRYEYSNNSFEIANSESRAIQNVIHSSDTQESAKKEIELWFSKYTLCIRKTDDNYEKIAGLIDLNSSNWIKDIVNISNEKKYIYHGIKKPEKIEKIIKMGIEPLTVESGSCSFWSTGTRLFLPSTDSPFFNYSGNYLDTNETKLNLAIANYDSLASAGLNLPDYKPDSQLIIKGKIPFNLISMLNVEAFHNSALDNQESRKQRQLAEQMLLIGIANQLCSEFTPGKVVKYSKDFREVKK